MDQKRRLALKSMFLTSTGVLIGATGLELILSSCSQKVNVSTPGDITIDSKHVGTIQGRVVSAVPYNNQVVWSLGIEGITVTIEDMTFKVKTIAEGNYIIDNVPARAYNILGNWEDIRHSYGKDKQPVLVKKQETVIAPDLKISPISLEDSIIYGKVFYENGYVYSNKKISINNINGWETPNVPIPGRECSSTITSSDGSYALYTHRGCDSRETFASPEGKVKMEGQENSVIN